MKNKRLMIYICIAVLSGIALCGALYLELRVSPQKQAHMYYSDVPGFYLYFDTIRYRFSGSGTMMEEYVELAGAQEGACITWTDTMYFLGSEKGPFIEVLKDGDVYLKRNIASNVRVRFYPEIRSDSEDVSSSETEESDRTDGPGSTETPPETEEKTEDAVKAKIQTYYESQYDTWLELGDPEFAGFLDMDSMTGKNKTEHFKEVRDNWVFYLKYLPQYREDMLKSLTRYDYEIRFDEIKLSGNTAEVRIYLKQIEPVAYPFFLFAGESTFRLVYKNERWLINGHDYTGYDYEVYETKPYHYDREELAENRIREYGLNLTDWNFDLTDSLKRVIKAHRDASLTKNEP